MTWVKVFKKMTVDKKLKLGSEFSMYCLKRRFPDGTKIDMSYLKKWLRGEKINL